MEKFVECLVKQDIPDKYFILLKNISEDNFSNQQNFWSEYQEINESTIFFFFFFIYSMVEKLFFLSVF